MLEYTDVGFHQPALDIQIARWEDFSGKGSAFDIAIIVDTRSSHRVEDASIPAFWLALRKGPRLKGIRTALSESCMKLPGDSG
jgi:hypothetical protein